MFVHRHGSPKRDSWSGGIGSQKDVGVAKSFQKIVELIAYLKWLTRYIHLNPVAAGLVAAAADWVHSSHREFVGLRQGMLPSPDIILSQFPSVQAYEEFVESPLHIEAGLEAELMFEE